MPEAESLEVSLEGMQFTTVPETQKLFSTERLCESWKVYVIFFISVVMYISILLVKEPLNFKRYFVLLVYFSVCRYL